MDMWHGLAGRVMRASGTSGTPTIPKGAVLINVQALQAGGGGSITGFPDGTPSGTITITLADGSNGFDYRAFHTNTTTSSANQLVFVATVEYFVEYMLPSGVSVVS
jgi:hypothetical protein